MMHGPINVKFPNNTSKWQMGFNLAFKGLIFEIKYFLKCNDCHYTNVMLTNSDPAKILVKLS
jgi:hypothetical protein